MTTFTGGDKVKLTKSTSSIDAETDGVVCQVKNDLVMVKFVIDGKDEFRWIAKTSLAKWIGGSHLDPFTPTYKVGDKVLHISPKAYESKTEGAVIDTNGPRIYVNWGTVSYWVHQADLKKVEVKPVQHKYQPNEKVLLTRDSKFFAKGELVKISKVLPDGIILERDGYAWPDYETLSFDYVKPYVEPVAKPKYKVDDTVVIVGNSQPNSKSPFHFLKIGSTGTINRVEYDITNNVYYYAVDGVHHHTSRDSNQFVFEHDLKLKVEIEVEPTPFEPGDIISFKTVHADGELPIGSIGTILRTPNKRYSKYLVKFENDMIRHIDADEMDHTVTESTPFQVEDWVEIVSNGMVFPRSTLGRISSIRHKDGQRIYTVGAGRLLKDSETLTAEFKETDMKKVHAPETYFITLVKPEIAKTIDLNDFEDGVNLKLNGVTFEVRRA